MNQLYTSMIAITNRHLNADYFPQITRIASAHPAAIVLREKDLPEAEYQHLAAQVLPICDSHQVPLVIHYYPDTAKALGIRRIHLPLHRLELLHQVPTASADSNSSQIASSADFDWIGTSIHSIDEAVKAEALGATCLFAGNIYETDCKKGLPGRGTEFLTKVCQSVSVPVYALGGITPERMPEILKTGAAGGCMMSGFMTLES